MDVLGGRYPSAYGPRRVDGGRNWRLADWIWFPFGKTCRDFGIIAPPRIRYVWAGIQPQAEVRRGTTSPGHDGCDGGVTVTSVRPETLTATIMSLETARDLSIPDLLRLLNEKLGLECTRLQETPPPPLVDTASLESEVSSPELIDPHPSKLDCRI